MYYKIKSKIYSIESEDTSPLQQRLLEFKPRYAVRVLEEGTKSLVLISDGAYCYFESHPQKYFKLLKPVTRNLPWNLMHKNEGPLELHK